MKIHESSEIEVFANEGGSVSIKVTDVNLEKTVAVIDVHLVPVLCKALTDAAKAAGEPDDWPTPEEQEASGNE